MLNYKILLLQYGTTALIWAARSGGQPKDVVENGTSFYLEESNNIVGLLLAAGASVGAVGMYSWTPLLVATRGNHLEAVNLILEINGR